MRFSYPALFSDIGGTNARFALSLAPDDPPETFPSLKTADYSDFAGALRQTLGCLGAAPKTLLVCAAGPVANRRVQLTNAGWDIDGPELVEMFGLQGLIFNDFEALALSIPALLSEWLLPIGAAPPADGLRLVHGPGTGLGSAALIDAGGKWLAIASEGSHSDFAAVYEDEIALWPHVERRDGRLTPETLISGPGLRRLHQARQLANGDAGPALDEATIIERALGDPSGPEGKTARLFWRLVARYAGDVALNFLATGGVILAGGILPRMLDLLDAEEFRWIFAQKAPYERLARAMPVHVLTQPDAVMTGMAAIAREPDRYLIDYAARIWANQRSGGA